ncbi:hypothetical protein BKA69DRAFT_1078805 [Paraphysoderma sedebokerense]|nr:hypothetical protein BKA69DRAFT_1078805 [Paraphysoderma sedebokerense]
MANKFHQMPSKPTSTSQPDSPAVPEKPKQNTNVEKDKNEPGADDGKHTPDGVWVPKSNAKDSEDKQKSKKLDKPKEEEKAPQPDQNEVARKLFTNLLDAEQGQKYNLKGEVVDLTFSNFDELTKDGPWLIEFYAPWCGHCKNLAPTYTKLGAELKDKVNVAKVNGDENRGLMDKFGIRGFPTIKYIRGSQIIDYRGPRTLEGLSSFALQASSISITLVTKSDFERMKDQNDVSVMFLFNSKTATSDMRTFISTAKTSVHQIPFYASYDPSFESSIFRPSVLVYRKGFPASHNPLKYSGDFVVSKILNFIDSNKHPLLPELDESNSRDFLEPNENESSNRITVIGVLNPVGSDKQRKVLKSVAESLVGRFDDGNTKVICTWLDGVKFAEYIDKVYKIKSTDLSRVIINVAKEEEYFDVDPSGKPIQFTENAILDALNDVVDQVRGRGGKYVGKSMRGTLMSYIKWGTKQFGGVTVRFSTQL